MTEVRQVRQGATKVRHNVEWNNFTTIIHCYGTFEFARTAIRIMLQRSYLTMSNVLQKIYHLGSDVFRGDMVRQGATGATRCDKVRHLVRHWNDIMP